MQIYQSAQITDKLNRINSKALEYFLSNYYNIIYKYKYSYSVIIAIKSSYLLYSLIFNALLA